LEANKVLKENQIEKMFLAVILLPMAPPETREAGKVTNIIDLSQSYLQTAQPASCSTVGVP